MDAEEYILHIQQSFTSAADKIVERGKNEGPKGRQRSQVEITMQLDSKGNVPVNPSEAVVEAKLTLLL